jgi:hypothetical protein
MSRVAAFLLTLACLTGRADTTETPPPWPGDAWRAAHRIIDLHQHLNGTEEHLRRAVGIMDRVGIGVAANLSGGTVTSKDGQPSAFEKLQTLGNRIAPDRFVLYFNLDYAGWDEPDFSARAVRARGSTRGSTGGAAGAGTGSPPPNNRPKKPRFSSATGGADCCPTPPETAPVRRS